MGIIKEDQLAMMRRVARMVFTAFPEEMLHTGHEDDDGGESQDAAAPVTDLSLDLDSVRREASEIVHDARTQADGIVHAAQREAETILNAARNEMESLRTAAVADGDRIRKEAYAAGFPSGEEAGFKKGFEDGYTKGKAQSVEEVHNAFAMMNRVIDELRAYRSEILAESRKDIVKMALAVAEKVLHKEIMLSPDAVVSIVKNALSKVNFKRQFTIQVNPLDMEVIQNAGPQISAMLDHAESLQFKADPKVEPGGCIVQTESGVVDAQVDRQFQEIRESVLGALEKTEP
jgi:flagellar assembly protein FliH